MYRNGHKRKKLTANQVEDCILDTQERRRQHHIESLQRANETNDYMNQKYPNRINNHKKEKLDRQKEIERLSNNLTFMVNELTTSILKDALENGAKHALKSQASALKTFIAENAKYMELNTTATWSYVGKLFYELSKEIPEFICYAPTELFENPINIDKNTQSKQFRLKTLTNAELSILDRKLMAERPGIVNNEFFAKNYLKYFPNHIARLKDQGDIVIALSNNPAAYKNVNSSLKNVLNNNQKLNYFLQQVPEIVEHMDKAEIEMFAGHESTSYQTALGNAFVKHPIALEKLDSLFFVRNNPKYIFARTHAVDLKAFEPIMDKFIGLREFYEKKLSLAKSALKRELAKKSNSEIVNSETLGLE